MKKLIFGIIAIFLVSGVFAQASAKKTPMYFAGAHYGTPVINYLPFNDAKGDTKTADLEAIRKAIGRMTIAR